jgi:hypothetical protein
MAIVALSRASRRHALPGVELPPLTSNMVQHLLLLLHAASLPVWARPMPAAGGCQRVPTVNDGR